MPAEQRLPAEQRIRKRADFLDVQGRGHRFVATHLIFFWKINDGKGRRLGVTASKKVGKAVRRNAVKRRAREVFREHKHELPVNVDLVIVARPNAARASAAGWEKQWQSFTRQMNRKAAP